MALLERARVLEELAATAIGGRVALLAGEAGKPLGDQVGDGGLAGRGQAGEPDGDSVGVRAR